MVWLQITSALKYHNVIRLYCNSHLGVLIVTVS